MNLPAKKGPHMAEKQGKCRTCDKPCAVDAKACPHCGAPKPVPHTSLATWLIGGLLLFFVIKVIGGSNTAAPPPAKTAEDIATEMRFQRVLQTANALKRATHNPDSLKIERAIYIEPGTVCIEFRARNAFNAVIKGHIVSLPDGSVSTEAASWRTNCASKTGEDFSYVRTVI